MAFKYFLSLAVLAGIQCVNGGMPTLDKCKHEDNECLKKSIQTAIPDFMAGIPELNVDVTDVMKMDDIKFDLSGLQFTLTDGTLKGLKTAVVDKASINMSKKLMNIVFHMDCVLKGHYTAAGRILILPITGDGELKIKNKNLVIDVKMPFDVVKGDDGKEHLKYKTMKFEFETKGGAHFALTNLFNGNKELSDAMHNFLNTSWQPVSKEFGKPLINSALLTLQAEIQKFMDKMALEDIFLQ